MEHKMRLCKAPFDKIASGEKTIELRLYDEKRQLVKVGDTITFTSLENNKDTITVGVVALYIFKSFDELYENLPLNKCGYREGETVEPSHMNKYYSVEKQSKYGVVGIEIRVI